VSLKGANEKMFSLITNADGKFFKYQLDSLKRLVDDDICCNAAIMLDLFTKEDIIEIKEKLRKIHPLLAENGIRIVDHVSFCEKKSQERGIKIWH
jgi:uncharacterized Fe-S cluster-containing radical SAM superfamily protein